eukprot:CAMPEP_0204272862 /NCGR_PEP_ID=MMETSP0468-20130131/22323_1 /ASSEMBLY_ACC=CAM_ASM_000383 /TAXON_ID=2969 /ORGANISM="Oxyrrhis marina" /LENGTH=276 /DNA_ID=CAMNT_0051248755 /DNA_START=6 /DNA_END=833 /DNA_ORIENTATION=-
MSVHAPLPQRGLPAGGDLPRRRRGKRSAYMDPGLRSLVRKNLSLPRELLKNSGSHLTGQSLLDMVSESLAKKNAARAKLASEPIEVPVTRSFISEPGVFETIAEDDAEDQLETPRPRVASRDLDADAVDHVALTAALLVAPSVGGHGSRSVPRRAQSLGSYGLPPIPSAFSVSIDAAPVVGGCQPAVDTDGPAGPPVSFAEVSQVPASDTTPSPCSDVLGLGEAAVARSPAAATGPVDLQAMDLDSLIQRCNAIATKFSEDELAKRAPVPSRSQYW